MKNIKNTVATLSLLGIIIMSNTLAFANTGIVMHDKSAPTTIDRVINGIRNIVIGQITGVTIQNRDGIMISD